MTSCDMCGKDTNLILVNIEGTELNVCSSCSAYGKKITKPKYKRPYSRRKSYYKGEESKERVMKGYPSVIRDKREEMGLKQKEFAMMLNEKESIIHKIESGNYKPSLLLAKKMEKILSLKLIEEIEDIKVEDRKKKTGALTIGDMIKLK